MANVSPERYRVSDVYTPMLPSLTGVDNASTVSASGLSIQVFRDAVASVDFPLDRKVVGRLDGDNISTTKSGGPSHARCVMMRNRPALT